MYAHAVLSVLVILCGVSSLGRVVAHDWWHIQDNASVHTARVLEDWMTEHGSERDANFPPCSPDLNLIENVFGIVVVRMSSEKLDTIPQLARAIQAHMQQFDPLRKSIFNSSWRDRLAAVRAAAGGPTRF